MSITELIAVVNKYGIDTVHPGYGFLSESPEFARRMWDEAGAVVVGPGWGILEATGDKLRAKALAQACEFDRKNSSPEVDNRIRHCVC